MKRNRSMIVILFIIYSVIIALLLIALFPLASKQLTRLLENKFDAEIIVVVFFALVICFTMLLAMLLKLLMRDNNNSFEKHSTLSDERSYLEREINDLNLKLVSNDNRWREVYHLILSSQKRDQSFSPDLSGKKFLSGFGIDPDKIEIQRDLAFVLTPFHSSFDQTYETIMKTCQKAKMQAMRGDEVYVPSDILTHIISEIARSRIVIANIDGRNPNVFYELGISQALGKPTILVAHKNAEKPFDVQSQYCVIYKDDTSLEQLLFDAILKVLASGA